MKRPDEIFGEQDFVWNVAGGGYEWMGPSKLMRLTARMPSAINPALRSSKSSAVLVEWRRYRPMCQRDLFQQFAEIPFGDRNAILQFANRFGSLGLRVRSVFGSDQQQGYACTQSSLKVEGRKEPRNGNYGETLESDEYLSEWENEIRDAKSAFELYQEIRENTVQVSLCRPVLGYETGDYASNWPRAHSRSDTTRRRRQIQCLVNAKLRRHVLIELQWSDNARVPVFRVMPKSLLGAMWLQFSRDASGNVGFRQCKVCGKILTISTRTGGCKSNSKTCSPACRQRFHRQRAATVQCKKTVRKGAGKMQGNFGKSVTPMDVWSVSKKKGQT